MAGSFMARTINLAHSPDSDDAFIGFQSSATLTADGRLHLGHAGRKLAAALHDARALRDHFTNHLE